jgi:hypothetical protein
MQTEKQRANLKPGGRGNPNWKRGAGGGGNPAGRKKNVAMIPDVLRAIGNEPVPPVLLAQLQAAWGPEFKPANMRDAALRVTYAQYAKGDPAARQFVAERTEGKVTDRLEVEDTTPSKVVFEEVLVGGKVIATAVKRTITRPIPDAK